MKTHRLYPHPDYLPATIPAVTVEVEVETEPSGKTVLTYTVERAQELSLPRGGTAERRDDLWKTTCFELFVAMNEDASYREFNFSPSSEWAAYAFDDYRQGRTDLDLPLPPIIAGGFQGTDYVLEATFDMSSCPPDSRLGLSVVLEEKDGSKSYWALAHRPVEPDFHHRDCFTLELASQD